MGTPDGGDAAPGRDDEVSLETDKQEINTTQKIALSVLGGLIIVCIIVCVLVVSRRRYRSWRGGEQPQDHDDDAPVKVVDINVAVEDSSAKQPTPDADDATPSTPDEDGAQPALTCCLSSSVKKEKNEKKKIDKNFKKKSI